MAKGYWIPQIDVSNPEGYKAYMAATPPAHEKYRVIAEGYDGPQPQPPQGASPPAAAAAKGYWIGQVDVTDLEGYKPYMATNQALFGAFGARYLVRGGKREAPEGKARERIVVLEFPSYEAALACYRSPAYQAAMKLRQGKGILDLAIVEGYDGPKF